MTPREAFTLPSYLLQPKHGVDVLAWARAVNALADMTDDEIDELMAGSNEA